MRDHIDQPKARKAQQADKDQGNDVYDHAMPILIVAFRAFVFREVGDRLVTWPGITDGSLPPLTSMQSTGSGWESYNAAARVVGDHRGRQAPPSPDTSAVDFSTQLLILWRHDGVSEQWACLRIVPLKLNDRICGSSTASAVFLNMRGANEL